jgi:hypothetical protein
MIGGVAADDTWGWNRYANYYVWYTYYDVSNGDVDECRLENADDILITPDQVPLNKMQYEFFNDATKQTIRRLLVAEAMITLGIIRGTNSGVVKIPNAELQLDYNMLLDLGKTEKDRIYTELKERLEAMLPWNIMKNNAEMLDSLLNILNKKPMGFFAI